MKTRQAKWDIHEAAASRRSNRWATTDRGWLFPASGGSSLGNYLDYGPCGEHYAARPDGAVHAVAYNPGGTGARTAWFRTPAEARAWIEAETIEAVPS